MSTFIEVVAWVIIGYAALPLAITLLDFATGLQVKDMRHGRAKTMSEEWPDLRLFLPVLAVGVSLLALQWNTDTAKWWLAHIPLFAVVVVHLASWIRSRVIRGPGKPSAEPS